MPETGAPDSTANVIAVSPNCFGGYGQLVAFRALPKVGVKHVELLTQLTGLDVIAPELLGDGGPQQLRDHLAQLGLSAVSVGAYANLLDPREVGLLLRRIDLAQQMRVGIVVSDATGQMDVDRNEWRKLIDAARYAANYAADRGVRIAIETHGLTRNAAAYRQFLDAVDHPHVGANYDTGNIYYYNDALDPAEDVKAIADRIFQVHLKDTRGGKFEWRFCPLGQGRVRFPTIIQTLRAVGFRGPWVIEIEGEEDEDLNVEGRLQALRQSLDYLRRLGLTAS